MFFLSLLKHKKNDSFLLASILLLAIYFLINSIGPEFLLLSVFLILFSFFIKQIFRDIFSNFNKKALLLIIVIQFASLLIFANFVLQAELWGDEVGVIQIAKYEFQYIAQAVTTHASALPFDYWMLHVWIKASNLISHPVWLNELIYRIPYFIFHCISTLYFGLITQKIVSKQKLISKKKSKQYILSISIASLLFFFNPLLLMYAFEVRFYSFVILGVVVTLYYYLTDQINSPLFLILATFFCLNSIYEFILLFPILGYLFVFKKQKETLYFGFFIAAIYLLTNSKLNLMEHQAVTQNASLKLIKSAFIQYNLLFFTNLNSVIAVIISFYISFKKKVLKEKHIHVLILIAFLFLATSISAYSKKYFDFHFRHFLVVTPLYLSFYILPLRIIKNKRSLNIYRLWLFIVLISYIINIFSIFPTFPAKTNLGIKNTIDRYNNSNKKYIVYSSQESPIDGFNIFSLDWYFSEYSLLSEVKNNETAVCSDECIQNKTCIVITNQPKISCLKSEQYQLVYFHFLNYFVPRDYIDHE